MVLIVIGGLVVGALLLALALALGAAAGTHEQGDDPALR